MKEVHLAVPISTVAKKYNIPRSTLQYKRGLSESIIKRKGPPCILGQETESRLVQWILYMSKCGFPVTKDQLINSVQMLLKTMKRKETTFVKNRPGRHWYEGFKRRHPELCEKMSQNLHHVRASITEKNLRDWFENVEAYLKKKGLHGIDASRVFNCDESAFLLAPKPGLVLVEKGDKHAYTHIKNNDKECLTTLFCGNAAGQLIPPMVMFKYTKIPQRISSVFPKGWALGHSDNGWETAKSFYDWVSNVFYEWLINHEIQFPILLFVDGHVSHLTLELTNYCKEKNIVLIALHANATHILQPMDVAVFRPLKLAWANAVRDWRFANDGDRLPLEKFAGVLRTAVEALDWKSLLNSGFRATGLHPFSADGVNYQKFFKGSASKTSVTPLPQRESSTMTQLRDFESCIDEHLLESFKNSDVIEEWTGDPHHRSLFQVWRKMSEMKRHATPQENDEEKPGNGSEETLVEEQVTKMENNIVFVVSINEELASVSHPTINDPCLSEADLSELALPEDAAIYGLDENGKLTLTTDNSLSDIMRIHELEVQSQSNQSEPEDGFVDGTDEISPGKLRILCTDKKIDACDKDKAHEIDGLPRTTEQHSFSGLLLEDKEKDIQRFPNSSDQDLHEKSEVETKEIPEASFLADSPTPTSTKTTPTKRNNVNETQTSEDPAHPFPNFPSPFKRVVACPGQGKIKAKKGRNAAMKAKMPSVAVSEDWEAFFEAKKELKRQEELNKIQKREGRKKIKDERVKVEELKRKNRKAAQMSRKIQREKEVEEKRIERDKIKKQKAIEKVLKKKKPVKASKSHEKVINDELPLIGKAIKKELIINE